MLRYRSGIASRFDDYVERRQDCCKGVQSVATHVDPPEPSELAILQRYRLSKVRRIRGSRKGAAILTIVNVGVKY
jgi:hypothetical protein